MEPEEVQAEELGNNPAEVGTPEQSEAEQTQTAETVEGTPEADPLASLPDEQREALIRAAQSRFTPAQQAKAEEARLAKEEARLAKEEARLEREQRLAIARHMEELQGKQPKVAEKKEDDDPEPDAVMDNAAWLRWSTRQEIKKLVNPLQEEISALKREKEQNAFQQRLASDTSRLVAACPDLADENSETTRTFNTFLNAEGSRGVQLKKLYHQGLLTAEELFNLALGSKAPAVAEAKVKQDLARKAAAQVAGPVAGATKQRAYSGPNAIEDAVRDAYREQMKGQG